VDSAEAWLAEHDPDYANKRHDWRHIASGEYVQPSQEAAWDEDANGPVADLVNEGKAHLVGAPLRRKCADCPYLFAPAWAHQVYCSERCRERAKKRRQRRENVPGHPHTL
jgi:hypothetical protein